MKKLLPFCFALLCSATLIAQVPTITSFTPTSGTVGTTVTITGTNFNTTPANNVVFFGATAATVATATATQLTVAVPTGATYASITVLNKATGLLATSARFFTTSFAPIKNNITTNDFSAKQDFTTGQNPHSIAVGDLDGDGKVDVAVPNRSSNTMTIMRNSSQSARVVSYTSKVVDTGSNPRFVSMGDLDADGKLDLVVANSGSNTLSIYRNISAGTGNIEFASKTDYSTGSSPLTVSIDDLDNDGKLDLAITNYDGRSISTLRNTSTGQGNINFSNKVDISTGAGSGPKFVAISDLDGDNLKDLVVVDELNNALSVFRNISGQPGSISYSAKIGFNTGNLPQAVSIGDLDGDGKADLVATNAAPVNTISVFRNAGSGVGSIDFDSQLNLSTGLDPYSVAIDDLNGDSKLDIITTNLDSKTISIFNNNSSGPGNIAYTPKVDVPTGLYSLSVKIADFDGDGLRDISVSNWEKNSVSIIRNIPRPTISSFTPNTGAEGSTVTINGSNFDATPGSSNNVVLFNSNVMSNGNTLTLNGTTDYVATPIDVSPTAMPSTTWEAWVFPFSSGNDPKAIMANGQVDFDRSLVVQKSGGNTNFGISIGWSGTWQPVAATLNQWQHVAVVYTADNVFFYKNGVKFTYGRAPSFNSTPNPLWIGKNTYSFQLFNGKIDEVRIWNIARTQSEIQATKNRTLSGSEAGLVAYYKLDEIGQGAGITVINSATAGGTSFNGLTNGTTSTPVYTIQGTAATIMNTTGSSITTTVPPGATTGRVTVTVEGLSATSSEDFAVATATSPTITGFNPTSGLIGTAVTITGTKFDATPANNTVIFNGITATVTAATATSITTSVPVGATTGKIKVIVGGETAITETDFTVTNPTISSFNPTSGLIGTAVTIIGTNFSTTIANNTVKFNGTTATVTASTATSITTTVPTGATTGKITVIVDGQTATSATDFTVTTATSPTITSFNPTSGSIGTAVTITGTNFDVTAANNTVRFNGTAATVTASTATSITTTVPTGATTGKITVIVGGQTATSSTDFTVTTATSPTIASFNPTSGLIGTVVTITGTNFNATATSNTVRFNGTTATVTASTATSITTTVPTGATTGKITVTVGGQTATSATDFTVTTSSTPVIASQISPTSFTKGSGLTASITVDDASKVSAVNFRSGGISEALATLRSNTLTASGNKYEKVLAASELTDPLGLVYYFEVLDKSSPAKTITSTATKAFVNYPAASTDQALPGLSFGTQVSNYQIIAFPFNITNNSVTSVFNALGTYDKTKWRLFDYSNSDNREYPGFSTIEPGKGYWLIVKNSTTINPGASTVVQADESNPFTINLQAGWNLIGNPYNFNVLWSDVLAANSALAGIAGVSQTLTTLSGSTLSNAATVLPKYRGAFVKAASAISLKIPVKYNSNAGRVASELKELASIDQPNWAVKLTLLQDGLRNEMAGIGMNTNASLKGKDKFDNERVPLPFDITELSSSHPEIVSAFNKDVVPTQDNFTWTFDVKHAQQLGNVTLTWERSNLNSPTKQLVLFDPATLHEVDMSTLSSYSITTATTQLQFIYGEKDFVQNVLDKELPLLGSPYPNPAKDEVTIPFRVSENDDQRQVQVKIYNAWGAEIATLLDRPMGKGSYEVSWQSQSSPGLYFVKMHVAGGQSGIVKLILK